MINRFGEASVHALEALTAITAVQTTRGFRLSGIGVVAQFHFFEIALTLLHGKFRHTLSGRDRHILGYRQVNRILFGGGRACLRHILGVKIALNRYGSFFAGRNGINGNRGTCLQITAGKNTLTVRGVCNRINFGSVPTGKLQAIHIF